MIILYYDDCMKYKLKKLNISCLPPLSVSATSTGSLQGLDNTNGGVCRTKSMKLVLRVGQSKYFVNKLMCLTETGRRDYMTNNA